MNTTTHIEKNEQLTPVLRFKEFGKEWKRTKLGQGIKLISGQHLSPGEYNTINVGTPYFTGPSDFTNEDLNVSLLGHLYLMKKFLCFLLSAYFE